MKKKLEAELISIAHRILKLKNKSDVEQLYNESRNLYEKLAILRFAEQNFEAVKPTIGVREIEQELESYNTQRNEATQPFAEDTTSTVDTPVEAVADTVNILASEYRSDGIPDAAVQTSDESSEEDIEASDDLDEQPATAEISPEAEVPAGEETEVAPEAETSMTADNNAADEKDEPVSTNDVKADEPKKEEFFIPSFDLTFDKKEDIATEDMPERKQVTFDDLLGPDYADPIFEKVETEAPKVEFDGAADGERDAFTRAVTESTAGSLDFPSGEYKPVAAKDTPARSISFGLNDRIGFEKHLFGGSSEDMNRVVSQLTTFDTFAEAYDFIEDMVKPDYNNWEGKEDYANRFMAIIEQRFS